jgi:hypothetical protein
MEVLVAARPEDCLLGSSRLMTLEAEVLGRTDEEGNSRLGEVQQPWRGITAVEYYFGSPVYLQIRHGFLRCVLEMSMCSPLPRLVCADTIYSPVEPVGEEEQPPRQLLRSESWKNTLEA